MRNVFQRIFESVRLKLHKETSAGKEAVYDCAESVMAAGYGSAVVCSCSRFIIGIAAFLFFLAAGTGLPFVRSLSFGSIEKAYANGPVPEFDFQIRIDHAPEDTKGLDFMVPKESIPEEEYLELNEETLKKNGFPLDCELASYEKEGAVSYSVHNKNGNLDSAWLVEWKGSLEAMGYKTGYDFVTTLGQETRIVLFDEKGNVLAVSDPFKAYASKPRKFMGEITYDAATGEVMSNGFPGGIDPDPSEKDKEMDPADTFFMVVALLAVLTVVALVTTVLELITGLFFRLKPIWWVIPVNLLSNLVFNLLLIICCFFLPVSYWLYVVIGELAVVAAEYGIYRQIYKDLSNKRLLIYSVVANVISAVIVIILTADALG